MIINNSIFNISLNTLYNSIENTNQIINENTKKTFFGFLIHHSISKDINNYELLNPHTGEILCMDEETCMVISTYVDSYTLFCINDKSHTPFQLMRNELFLANVGECHNWTKDPNDITLSHDHQKMQNNLFYKNKYENVCIPKNASLACSTCKYHSLNGCTNINLIYDYCSALDDEKEYILNGEYCKYCYGIN